MKKFLLSIFIIAISVANIYAQPPGGPRGRPMQGNEEAMESIKVAFLTRQLALTPEEAQKFWPVYNQYIAELRRIRKENNGGDELELREKMLSVTKRYKPDFIKCIGAAKFNQLLKLEGDWRQVVQEEIKRRREMNKNQKNKLNAPNAPGF
jgi:hypothetical protein